MCFFKSNEPFQEGELFQAYREYQRTSLTEAIALSGEDFSVDKLGNRGGQYLQFDSTKGWAIKKMNMIKRIARSIGFYPSTHLNHIYKQYDTEQIVSPDLDFKVRQCWLKKTYGIAIGPDSAQHLKFIIDYERMGRNHGS